MSIRDDLDTLIDQLDEDTAVVALSFLRNKFDPKSRVSQPIKADENEPSQSEPTNGPFADEPQ